MGATGRRGGGASVTGGGESSKGDEKVQAKGKTTCFVVGTVGCDGFCPRVPARFVLSRVHVCTPQSTGLV
jgi:hypothetical protein